MTVMSTATGLPYGRALTADDLDAIPDDGHRYELLDGTLLVSPAPGWDHQDVTMRLVRALEDARPRGVRVLAAPFAFRPAANTELQPDVFVARYEDLTLKNLPVVPLLVVEVRSPSTALIDRNLKRAAYERLGVRSYWLVDPRLGHTRIEVFELREDAYVEVAAAAGSEEIHIHLPFPVVLRPAELVVGLIPD